MSMLARLGGRVQSELYAFHHARATALGLALISAFLAEVLFGSPLGAQDAYGNIFGSGDLRAEQLQQRPKLRAARRTQTRDAASGWRRRAHTADGRLSTSDKNSKEEVKKSAPVGAV